MTLTQTVEITDSRRLRLDFEVPREVPAGKARVELKVVPFVRDEEKPAAAGPPERKITREELDEMIKNSPHTRALAGILSGMGDITLEQIRDERLARHLR